MTEESAHFRLRIPRTIHSVVAEQAKANRRSMNAEIVILLERALGLRPEKETADCGVQSSQPAEIQTNHQAAA